MKILFTGGSSFSGMWFIKELALEGHQVIAPLRKERHEYSGLRLQRIEQLALCADVRFATPYGSSLFFDLLTNTCYDLFCHHAADVTNYKSPDFNVPQALENNVGPLPQVLKALERTGCSRIVLTGTVFEQNEGEGSDALRAVSPYGLSKGLTSAVFKYYCEVYRFHLGKFVIPNPFGPYEEFRFTSFLAKNWFEKKIAPVSTPAYVRDNIHISLLAKAYRRFVEILPTGYSQLNPSGYRESQGAFTKRFSEEMKKRLQLPCEYVLKEQLDFPEPKLRVNKDTPQGLKWDETEAWDALASYYDHLYKPSFAVQELL